MINMKRISDIMWGLIFIIIGVILGGNALDIFNINLFLMVGGHYLLLYQHLLG